MSVETQELQTPHSLLGFMESEKAEAAKAAEAAAEKPEVTSGSEVPAGEEVSGETGGSPITATAEEEATQEPTAESAWLRGFLEKANFDSEGIPDDELEQLVLAELRAEKPQPDVADTKKQDTANQETKDGTPLPLPAKDGVESEKEGTLGKSVGKLEYDARLAAMVTFDASGRAVANEDFGDAGREAAQKINDYSAARRKRVEDLVDDPIGYLMADLKREMESVVGSKLNEFRAEQQTSSQAAEQERLAQEEIDRVAAIMRANEARFYKTGVDGKPRVSLKTQRRVLSDFGSDVDTEFRELKAISPGVPDSVILEKAMRIAERYHVKPTSPGATAESTAEKKKQFLAKDRTNTQTDKEADREPASLGERLELGGGTTLLDAVLNNPDLIDNPVVAKLRQAKETKPKEWR